MNEPELTWIQPYTREELRKLQEEDEWYGAVRDLLGPEVGGESPPCMSLGRAGKTMYGMHKHLAVRDRLIYREWRSARGKELMQLVTPTLV